MSVKVGYFYFDPNDKIYLQHFPDNPIVPGTLIIKAFIDLIDNGLNMQYNIKNFRFKKFVKPKKIKYEIKIDNEKYKCFLLDDNDKILVSGEVETTVYSS